MRPFTCCCDGIASIIVFVYADCISPEGGDWGDGEGAQWPAAAYLTYRLVVWESGHMESCD